MRAQSGADLADGPLEARLQDDCRLPSRQWPRDPQDLPAVYRALSRHRSPGHVPRCHRREQVRSYTREKLRRRLGEIDAAIDRYMGVLDRADEVLVKTGMHPIEARLSRVIKKLAHYRKEARTLRAIEERMDGTGETQVSLTDPDCRAMATTSKQPRVVGYNVQSAVETKHHLIVAYEVTNLGYDRDALSMMAHKARDAMAAENIEAIADKGYYKGEEIVACEQAGIAVTVSKPHTSNAAAAGRFDRADFIYHAEEDACARPANGSPTTTQTRKPARRCATTGRTIA